MTTILPRSVWNENGPLALRRCRSPVKGPFFCPSPPFFSAWDNTCPGWSDAAVAEAAYATLTSKLVISKKSADFMYTAPFAKT